MAQVLSIPTDNFPTGTLIDIPWTSGKKPSDTIGAAAELIAGGISGKIARKVAIQAAKMSLGAQMRKLEEGGRLLIVTPPAETEATGKGKTRLLTVRASIEPTTTSHITNPTELKTALITRTPHPTQYLQHPTLGYGGRAIGVTQEHNVETHQAYYAFIDPAHQTITQFDASIETNDGAGLTKDELETVAEIVKRANLAPANQVQEEAAHPAETPED